MRIIKVEKLAFPEVKVIHFARFTDQRGYFTEHFRKSDFLNHSEIDFIKGIEFVQCNESFSKKGTVRGLHFQWNPYMGKMVRTISGHMIDLVLDIRKNSPNFGKIIAYDMPSNFEDDSNQWIWVSPRFAHGNLFLKDTLIEYLCTGEYNPNCEAGISPLAPDIDWSICDKKLKLGFEKVAKTTKLISEKDRNGLSISEWKRDERSNNFIY